jgi:hypothetical protein
MNEIDPNVPGYSVICRAWWCAFNRAWRDIGFLVLEGHFSPIARKTRR